MTEDIINQVLQSHSLSDNHDFNPFDIVNKLFPDEESLKRIPTVSKQIETAIEELDCDLEKLTLSKMENSTFKAKQSIEELILNMNLVKSQANQSESMVNNITDDIRILDCAKKNLTNSVTVLKRIQMLTKAVNKLVNCQDFKEISQLLRASCELLEFFAEYDNEKLDELRTTVSTLKETLKRKIKNEWETSFSDHGVLITSPDSLTDSCLVIEVIEGFKEETVNWFCHLILCDFTVEHIPWFKRLLSKDEVKLFPEEWNVPEAMFEKFAVELKRNLSNILSTEDASSAFIRDTMKQVLKFEYEMEKQLKKRFNGIISNCFEPFLEIIIDEEEHQLEKIVRGDHLPEDNVFSSSADLFLFYRSSLQSFSLLTRRRPLLDLYNVFKKYLEIYCDEISSKDKFVVVNTMDYCLKTSIQLQSRVMDLIDAEFKEKVTMNSLDEKLNQTIFNAVNQIIKQYQLQLDPIFQEMTKQDYEHQVHVMDHSQYVTKIISLWTNTNISQKFTNQQYTKTTENKLVDCICQKFYASILKCRRIGQVGAEQLLLDVETLLNRIQNPFMTKLLSKSVSVLKLLMSEEKSFVSNYLLLCSDEKSDSHFRKMCQLANKAHLVGKVTF